MQFFSLDIYNGRYGEFIDLIKNPEKKTLVFTPNPEILVGAHRDGEFMNILKQADYLTPDANGLYTASLIQEGMAYPRALIETLLYKGKLRRKYGELIQGSNLTKNLVESAEQNMERILIIDNYRIDTPENPFEVRKKEIQSQLSGLFMEKFPDLGVTVFFDGEKNPAEIAEFVIAQDIRYVFSCIGMKEQEKRLIEIFSHLPESQRVVGLGVGSSLDYLLGLQHRAPLVFQNLGLEWLYRLVRDPSRWRRIWTAVVEFPMMIARERNLQK